MRRLAALTIATTLTAGCSSYTASKHTAVLGGALTVVGVGAFVMTARDDTNAALAYAAAGAALLSVGVLTMTGGLIGMHHFDERQPAPTDPLIESQQRERARSAARARGRAWSLTKEAADAARSGDCATVSVRDGQVRDLDSELHDTVFVRDTAIARCLEAHR